MLKPVLIGILLVSGSFSSTWAEDSTLESIADRYESQQQLADERMESAETSEEREAAFIKLHPVNMFVDDFLAVEQAHRGKPAAISALSNLMRNACGVGNPEFPASQGRVKAIEILREHYLEHPDLDLMLNTFHAGTFVPEAETLLRDATKSPHRHVRAAARYYLASFLNLKATLWDTFGPGSAIPEAVSNGEPYLLEHIKRMRKQVKGLAIDPGAARDEALLIIEELISQDSDVEQAYTQNDPQKLDFERADPTKLAVQPRTYADLAKALQFEIQRLQPGQTAPEITGVDVDGLEFNLSDYRGRVVLLIFSANWCGPCKAMYPDLRKLLAELDDKPFAVLAVMGDRESNTVVEATDNGDIRWRTWFDGYKGPIARTWNVHSWPTFVVIDHNGTIVNRDGFATTYENFREVIDPLLAAQQDDPDSQELLDSHPLPELPSLSRAE